MGEKVATNLRAARALIANGWCQGSFEMGSRRDRILSLAGSTPIKSVEFANPSNVVRLPVRLRPVPNEKGAA